MSTKPADMPADVAAAFERARSNVAEAYADPNVQAMVERQQLEARIAILESLLREAEIYCPKNYPDGPPLLANRIIAALEVVNG